jgi:16S rRNA G966 N2-methylase RsmD
LALGSEQYLLLERADLKPKIIERVATFKIASRKQWISGEIVQAEALAFLKTIPDGSASIVFLDPPFNLGKKYHANSLRLDNKPTTEYELWLTQILRESAHPEHAASR